MVRRVGCLGVLVVALFVALGGGVASATTETRQGTTTGPNWTLDLYVWTGSVARYSEGEARVTVVVEPNARIHAQWECQSYGGQTDILQTGSDAYTYHITGANSLGAVMLFSGPDNNSYCAYHIFSERGQFRVTAASFLFQVAVNGGGPGSGGGSGPTPTPTDTGGPTPTPTPTLPPGYQTPPPESPSAEPSAPVYTCPLPSGYYGPPTPTSGPSIPPGCTQIGGPSPSPSAPPDEQDFSCVSGNGSDTDGYHTRNAVVCTESPIVLPDLGSLSNWLDKLRVTVHVTTADSTGALKIWNTFTGDNWTSGASGCAWTLTTVPADFVCDNRGSNAADAGSITNYGYSNSINDPFAVGMSLADWDGRHLEGSVSFSCIPGADCGDSGVGEPPDPSPSPSPDPSASPSPTAGQSGSGDGHFPTFAPPSSGPNLGPNGGLDPNAPGGGPPNGTGIEECDADDGTYTKPGQAPLRPLNDTTFPGSINPLDYLPPLGAMVSNIPIVIGNAAQWSVNTGVDLVVPGSCVATMITTGQETLMAKAPFSLFVDAQTLLDGAISGAGTGSPPSMTIAGVTIAPLDDIADNVEPYRGWMGAAVWFLGILGILRLVAGTAGVTNGGAG